MAPSGRAAAVLLALALLPTVGPAAAHVVSDRDLAVVARIPAAATRELARSLPDPAGDVAPNRAGAWRGVGYQRGGLLLLVDAAARGDTARAERCWRGLERTFEHQLPEGGFHAAGTSGADDEPAWINAACRALIAVMNSRLQDRFRWRYALLKPKLQRAVDAFERRSEEFRGRHADRPALLLTAAGALLLADGIYHDARYGLAGQRLLIEALARQGRDGAFAAGDRPRAAEHALGLGALQSVAIYFPAPSLERAAARGRRWLERHGRERPAPRAARSAATVPAGAAAATAAGRFEPVTPAGEIEFVLRYGAIRPPPPAPGVPH